MSATGLSVFGDAMHKMNAWPTDLMERLHDDDRDDAYRAPRETLRALRDRLPANTAAAFSAFPCWRAGFIVKAGGRATSGRRPNSPTISPRRFDGPSIIATRRGLRAPPSRSLNEEISRGEIDNVKSCLPPKIRNLWPNGSA